MNPTIIELNQLRILNDLLSQTVAAVAYARTTVLGGLRNAPIGGIGVSPVVFGHVPPVGVGLSHSTLPVSLPIGASPLAMSPIGHAMVGGLSHTPVAMRAFPVQAGLANVGGQPLAILAAHQIVDALYRRARLGI